MRYSVCISFGPDACDLARSQIGVEYMFARMDYDLKCIAMHGT